MGPGPIRDFFDAFFYATEYYIFVGLIQVLAGVLLLFPSTVALGAILFVPVILNIFIITVALNFTGTWLITALMLTAAIYLLCWEFDRWQTIVPGFSAPAELISDKNLGFWSTVIFGGLAGLSGLGFLFTSMALYHSTDRFILPLTLLLLSAAGLIIFIKKHREYHISMS